MHHLHRAASQVNEKPLEFLFPSLKQNPIGATVDQLLLTFECSIKEHKVVYLLLPSSYPPQQKSELLARDNFSVLAEMVL